MMARLFDITGKCLSGEWGIDDDDGTGIPILRTTNFTNEGIINYNNVVTRQINKKNIQEKYLRNGDIIIEKSGGSDNQPVGRVVFFEGEENIYLFNNFTGLLRVKNQNKWYPKYVFYTLFANYLNGGTRQFENKTTGLHNLKTDSYVSSIEIREISFEKQEKIVKNLDSVCRLIELRKQQLSKLDELVKSRFIEMFGDPLVNDKCYPSENGKSLFAFSSGKFLCEEQRKDDGIPVYGGNGIAWHTDDALIDFSTIIIGRVGAYCGNVKIVKEPVWITDNAIYIKEFKTNKFNLDFLYMLMTYLNFSQHADFSGQPKVTQKPLENVQYIIPPIDLQNQFAEFVEQTDKSKLVIQQSLDKLETMKKALMQQYFG